MKKVLLLILSAFVLGGLASAQDMDDGPMIDITAISMGSGTIVDYLMEGTGDETTCALQFEAMDNMDDEESEGMNYSCLVEAVVAAGLAETLAGEGPFTVFAPTDSAFYNFAQEQSVGTPAELFADVEMLTSILTYHVVPDVGSLNDIFFSQDAEAEVYTTLATVNGAELPIEFPTSADEGEGGDEAVVMVGESEGSAVGQAFVAGTNISVDNGHIIPITEVLLPPMAE